MKQSKCELPSFPSPKGKKKPMGDVAGDGKMQTKKFWAKMGGKKPFGKVK